jgi:hypothetical protein
MATKPIRSYAKRAHEALEDVRKSNKYPDKPKRGEERHITKSAWAAGKNLQPELKTITVPTRKVRKALETEDDSNRLRRKRPKGMSAKEWRKQVNSGEAMVQNALESKRTKPDAFSHGLKKIKPSGPKKPKEFIITTKREPKKIENPKAAARARAKAVLRKMAAKRKKK